jgi:hypothetical protein
MGATAEMAFAFAHLGFAVIYGSTVLFVPDSLYGREHLTFKQRYLIFMSMSTISSVLEGMIGLSTLASCFLYIAETYEEIEVEPICDDLENADGAVIGQECWYEDADVGNADCTDSNYFLAEAVLSTGFAFHFSLYLYLAPDKTKYLFSLQTLVDFLTIAPVYFTVCFPAFVCTGVLSSSLKFVRVVRLLRVLRSLTLIASGAQNPIVFQLVVTIATMVVTIVFAAGIVHFMQSLNNNEDWNSDKPLTFVDSLYFTVTTFSTVGYGDFSPATGAGEIITIVLILFTIYIVPTEASKLSFLMNMQSKFHKPYEPQGAYTHVVIACNVTCRGIETFLHELYHDDHIAHGSKLLKAVVLAPDEPNAFMNELLLKYSPGNRLTFIKGDARVHDDLRKAKVHSAGACFILSDREAEDSNHEDAISVLRAMSMKTFDMNTTLYVQVIEPENKRYLVQAGIERTNIVCINELEMKLTAQTCQCTGFAAFLTNLISSSTFPAQDFARPWHKEYWSGMSNEIYRLALSSRFDGLSFAVCAKEIYLQNHALFFAVKPVDGSDVFLFPGSEYTLKAGDIGYFIAEHFKIVETLGEEGEAHEPVENILSRTEQVGNTMYGLFAGAVSACVPGTPASSYGKHPGMVSPNRGSIISRSMPTARRRSRTVKVAHYSLNKLTKRRNSRSSSPESPPNQQLTPNNFRARLLGDAQAKGVADRKTFLAKSGSSSNLDTADDSIQEINMPNDQGPDRCSQLQKAVLQVFEEAYCEHDEDAAVAFVEGGEGGGENEKRITSLSVMRRNSRRGDNESFLKDLSQITGGFTNGKAHMSFSASEITSLLTTMNLTLQTSSAIRDEVNFIGDHILVITPTLDDVRHFLLPLRHQNTVAMRSIVILTPKNEHNFQEVKKIKEFSNVFCIFGDRRLREDLVKAGIARAYCVVVLAERRKSLKNGIRAIDPDADVILTAKDIAMFAKGSGFQHMIVQLHDCNYIQHLPSAHLLSARRADKAQDLDEMLYGYHFRGDYHFQPSFAAGHVVLASFAELLMAQCFYNPEIVQIVRTLAGGGITGGDDDETMGEEFFMDDRAKTQAPANLNSPSKRARTKKLEKETKRLQYRRSYPAQLDLPPDFAGKKTFGELVVALLAEDILPLALYRNVKLARGVEISFVYTNPDNTEKLQVGDSIFAIVHDLASHAVVPGAQLD